MIGAAAQQEEQEREARLRRLDWCALLGTGPGYRCMLRLVTELGAGRLTTSEADQTMKNIAEQLLDEFAEAHPDAYLRMMGQLRGINTLTGDEDGGRDDGDDGDDGAGYPGGGAD